MDIIKEDIVVEESGITRQQLSTWLQTQMELKGALPASSAGNRSG
jgi:hypothetical protein